MITISNAQMQANLQEDNSLDLTECECHSGHEQNDTVCRWCWAAGRRNYDDPDVLIID